MQCRLTAKVSGLDKWKCAPPLFPICALQHCAINCTIAPFVTLPHTVSCYRFLGRSSDGSVGVWKCSNRVLDRNKSGHQWDRKMSRKSIIPWYRIYMGRMPQLQECVICILLTLGYIEFGTQLNQTYCHQRAKVMSSGQVLSLQLSFWKGM